MLKINMAISEEELKELIETPKGDIEKITTISSDGRALLTRIPKKITDDLVIDHDHETGKFRGWLCRRCNIALGKFNDDIPTLKNAIKYLKGGSFFSKIFGGK